MKKLFVILSLLALAGALLTACAPGLYDDGNGNMVFHWNAPAPASTEAAATAPSADTATDSDSAAADLACGSIQYSKDNGETWHEAGVRLENTVKEDIGGRVTFTNRSKVVPNKEYNEELTDAELDEVEKTWLMVRINPCGKSIVVFAGGINLNGDLFNEGALFQLEGPQEFRIRNGEAIIWDDETHMDKDVSTRINDQIKNGNFDIRSQLGLAVGDTLVNLLDDEIAAGVQIVSFR